MPTYFVYIIYTGLLAVILISLVPKKDILNLAIYGIIFGAIFDICSILFGLVSGLFHYVSYDPLGFSGIPFLPPIAWSIYYIMHFYFLPSSKIQKYVYVITTVFYQLLFANVLINFKILEVSNRIIIPLVLFSIWSPAATCWFLRLKRDSAADNTVKSTVKTKKMHLQPE